MVDTTYQPKVYRDQGGNRQVVASGGTLLIEPGGLVSNLGARYDAQPTPNTQTVAVTLTIANLLTKIINATPTATGATAAYTLPTGALTDAGVTMEIDQSFDWVLINNALAAADTITLTAADAHTIVGGPIVQSLHVSTGGITGYSAMFRTRKTAAGTFVTYRIA